MFSTLILNKVYELIPVPIFIVNKNGEIVNCNNSGLKLLNIEKLDTESDLRGGNALQCIHAYNDSGGCGCSEACKQCILRNSVTKSFNGINVFQEQSVIHIYHKSQLKHVTALITVINLDIFFSLLLIENITDLVNLQKLIPMCSHCKQIRDGNKTWNTIEEYISTITGSDITHGMCPECMKKLYPDLSDKILNSDDY